MSPALNVLQARTRFPTAPPVGGGLAAVKYGANAKAIGAPIPAVGATHICIVVHGGWWSEEAESEGKYEVGVVPVKYNDATTLTDLHANGYAIFDVNYQLAKTIIGDGSNPTSYPEQNTEVKEAVEYVLKNWAALGFPNPASAGQGIFLLGGSAGGNLALLAAQELCKAKPGALKGVAVFSAPCDLAAWAEGAAKGQTAYDRLCSTSNCATHAEPLEPACKVKMEERSPIKKISVATDPPHYIEGALEKDLVPWAENGKRMVEALQAAGVSVHEKAIAGGAHSFKGWAKYNTDLYAWMATHG